MWKVAPTIRIVLVGASLGFCVAAQAASAEAPDADALPPRFEAKATLRALPDRRSADGRFQLDARLRPADSRGQSGAGLTLRAKLAGATAAACDGSAIFSDGFESPGPG